MPGSASKLNKLFSFAPPAGVAGASGACALATILHFHEIGWNHLPKDRQKNPLNDLFVLETMHWSGLPDNPHPMLNTSPKVLVTACEKAGLLASWYAGNPENTSFELLCSELNHHRPVMVLMNLGDAAQPGPLEWEVVYRVEKEVVCSTSAKGGEHYHKRSISDFKDHWTTEPLALGCNLITVGKDFTVGKN